MESLEKLDSISEMVDSDNLTEFERRIEKIKLQRNQMSRSKSCYHLETNFDVKSLI